MAIDYAFPRWNVTTGTLHNKSRTAMRSSTIVRSAERSCRYEQYHGWQCQIRMLPIASRTLKHRIPYIPDCTLSPSSSDKALRGSAPAEPRELSAPFPSVLLDLPERESWLLELRTIVHNSYAKDDPYRGSCGVKSGVNASC